MLFKFKYMSNRKLPLNIINNKKLVKAVISQCGYLYLDYNEIIIDLIREKYNINDEFAILRQRDTKPDVFSEYNVYVEKCKTKAKEIWARQEDTINRLLKEKGMS